MLADLVSFRYDIYVRFQRISHFDGEVFHR